MIDLSSFDLSYRFGADLREIYNTPSDVVHACQLLQDHVAREADSDELAKALAHLGALQRGLGQLDESEKSLTRSLKLLSDIGASAERIIAAWIRLAHVYHWQERYTQATQLFHECITDASSIHDQGSLKAFALQHLGKCQFDQGHFEQALQCFYDAMMIRVRLGNQELADSSRLALDRTIEALVPPLSENECTQVLNDDRLPSFVHHVLGKRHGQSDLPNERSNCINAVMNFFLSPPYRFQTATPLELLRFIQDRFQQVESDDAHLFGDVLLFWTRNGGAWADRKIVVEEMAPNSPEFPYGLVFEHTAVIVGDKIVFHKPSPSRDVPYKLERLSATTAVLQHQPGFEITVHRMKVPQTPEPPQRGPQSEHTAKKSN